MPFRLVSSSPFTSRFYRTRAGRRPHNIITIIIIIVESGGGEGWVISPDELREARNDAGRATGSDVGEGGADVRTDGYESEGKGVGGVPRAGSERTTRRVRRPVHSTSTPIFVNGFHNPSGRSVIQSTGICVRAPPPPPPPVTTKFHSDFSGTVYNGVNKNDTFENVRFFSPSFRFNFFPLHSKRPARKP